MDNQGKRPRELGNFNYGLMIKAKKDVVIAAVVKNGKDRFEK
jgi:hypothetical protein